MSIEPSIPCDSGHESAPAAHFSGRRRRILHCIWRLGLGGAERQLILLSTGLAAQGADVHVLTAHAGYCDEQLAATSAVPHRLALTTNYDVTMIPRLVALVKRLRPDVITTWLTQMDIVAGLAAQVARTPFVICERSGPEAYPRSLLHGVRSGVGRRAAAIIANSHGGREYWRRRVSDDRITVIPNIVPAAQIESAQAAETRLHPDAKDVILYVGRFGEEKNVSRLIDALALVLPHRPAIAVFCGEGVLRTAMERKAKDLGISDRTFFLGAVPDVWSWMKRASVVVAVSIFEGNPNIVLEAIACGTPLVVSDIEGYTRVVDTGMAAVVDPFSPESIAKGIGTVLDDPEDAKLRASRARRTIEGRNEHEIAERYLAVFERVAGRSR